MEKINFSVIIIAKDEEEMIGECLESVKWVDEIVLLDGGSVDNTLEIAKKYKAKIFPQEVKNKDWAAWHNQGLKVAQGEWIFYLDADERLTPELQKEIQEVIKNKKYLVYAIPRRNVLLDKPMFYGGWYPDYQIRFFKKEKLIRWEGKLHERPIFKGELGYLKNPMFHLTHRDLGSMVEKTKEWSVIEASLLFQAHHPPVTWWRILRMMFTEFWERGLKKQGWRDGTVGWIEIIFQMFSRFITYARLWEMQSEK